MKYTAKIVIHYFIEAGDVAEACLKAMTNAKSVELETKSFMPNIRMVKGYFIEEPEGENQTAAWDKIVRDLWDKEAVIW